MADRQRFRAVTREQTIRREVACFGAEQQQRLPLSGLTSNISTRAVVHVAAVALTCDGDYRSHVQLEGR